MNTAIAIHPDMMLPELFRRHPETRAVFDRYGLSGCGGRTGPHESIRFFARTHGVAEERLLGELQTAITERERLGGPAAASAASAASADAPAASVADTIYRRFFLAGILTVLTVGAGWGAWLLWNIGFNEDFTSISIHHVNAHGHAQIFGWVGLFIMGFAYQAFPRLWHTRLVAPRLAVAAFSAMLAGIALRTAGMTAVEPAWALPMAMGGGALELAAITTFVSQLAVTFRRSEARFEPYLGFAFLALLWFVAQAAMSLWHTWNTMTAATTDDLLWFVATYQAPLRDLQIHGLALFMILGVSMRMLPALFDLPKVPHRRAWSALTILTFGLLGEMVLFIAYRWTGQSWIAALLLLPWLALAAGALMIAGPWRLWRPIPTLDGRPDRMTKFLRAAYAWLAVSMILLLALPLYQLASGISFSHAYYGAIRHAITVGFISIMIMGFAAKVVPTLTGVDVRRLPALWIPFILINVGCFLRVSTQILTDWYSGFYAVIGLSGMLEVTALAWWGIGLVALMRRGSIEETLTEAPERIEPAHRVADVLRWYPRSEAIFLRHGFDAITNPVLRRTLARQVSLAQASRLKGVDLDRLVRDLNQLAGQDRALRHGCEA